MPTERPPSCTRSCPRSASKRPTSAPTRGRQPERAARRRRAKACVRYQRVAETTGRRAFVVVIDACGVGALPDASAYGDEGTNTLVHLADAVGGLELPALAQLGLGSIVAVRGLAPAVRPAIHGRLHPLGPGKDSITGHWELMGGVVQRRL